MATTDQSRTTPPALVAIAVAARKTGDRDLERAALRELREVHGIRLSFARGDQRAESHRA
jgi:hypothetical protein